ncbi:MAG: isocitrate/isopropylmalate family dehydrogenase, partial [Candidatus Margulisiibacteriota bacterium]
MTYNITLIPGDGIGPEVSNAARRCVDATGVKVNWEIAEAGADIIAKYGTPLPETTLASIRKNKIALKGP